MELVPLGDSGVLVSRVGLGCNAFGRRIDRERTRAVVEAAVDAGITHFDTADVYSGGDSERLLADALRGRRGQVVIATKFGASPGTGVAGGSPQYVRTALDRSLGRLRTDYIDLFYYHMPDGVTPLDETLGALDELRREGKIRAIGCSNLNGRELGHVLAGDVRIDALQNELNLLDREAKAELLPLCREHGVGFVPYRPLAAGLLAREPGDDPRLAALAGQAAALGLTLHELALAWLASISGVASVIPGASSPAQVRANAATADRSVGIVAPMTVGMVIRMEDINNSEHGPLFVGSRQRLASATAVRVLDEQRLVCTNLVGKRMYLVDYNLDSGAYAVKTVVPTTYEGREVETDLIDFDGRDAIVTSNCDERSMSLYRLEGDAIHHVKDLPIRDENAGFCHGVKFVPGRSDVVCAACIGNGRYVFFVSTGTGEVLYKFNNGDWIPRDACFVSHDRVVVAYSRGYPGGAPDDPNEREARASLFSIDLDDRSHELLSEAELPGCQAESCIHHDGKVYVTDQLCDAVIVCEVHGDRIEPTLEIPGYDFPHGVDFLPERNLLAVTNYGSNTIVLRQL
jgi:aryl-alcohol dehydrogenase-like predicted oxidoreductase